MIEICSGCLCSECVALDEVDMDMLSFYVLDSILSAGPSTSQAPAQLVPYSDTESYVDIDSTDSSFDDK